MCVLITVQCLTVGHALLPSTGFAAMTIFNCLRFPLSEFPEIAGMYIQSKISLTRFENFLQNEDIKGLFTHPPAAVPPGDLTPLSTTGWILSANEFL